MDLLSILISGLSLGSIYALVALGIVILYKASETLNFAHGSFVVLGAYVTARTYDTFGFFGAALAGILAAAGLAVLVERSIIRSMKDAPVVSLAIVTIGVEVMMNTELIRQIGADILPLGHPWGNDTLLIASAHLPYNRLFAIMSAIVIVALFLLAFRFSNWGIAMRAAAEDRETAELMGVKLGRVTMVAWATAGALAAVAGIFLTGSPTPGLTPTLAIIAMRAIPAAIVGGLDSVSGALVGGLLIGMVETLATTFQSELSFLGRGVGDIMPYVVMIIVLIFRPQGLFGRKESVRV